MKKKGYSIAIFVAGALDEMILFLEQNAVLQHHMPDWLISQRTAVALMVLGAIGIFLTLRKSGHNSSTGAILEAPSSNTQPIRQKQEVQANPTINVYPQSAQPAQTIPREEQEEDLPSLRFVEAKMIFIRRGNRGEFIETDARGAPALVATFRNPPVAKGEKNLTVHGVTAHLQYANPEGKTLDVTSTWLNERLQYVTFERDGKHQLVIAIRGAAGELIALANRNSDFPVTYTRMAQAQAVASLKRPGTPKIMSGCNKIEIVLIGGSSERTIYSETFNFETKEGGDMCLIKA